MLVARSEATGGPPNVRPPVATDLKLASRLGHVTLCFRRECRWLDEGWGRDKRQSHVRYSAKLTAHDTGHTRRATSFVNAHKEGHVSRSVYYIRSHMHPRTGATSWPSSIEIPRGDNEKKMWSDGVSFSHLVS